MSLRKKYLRPLHAALLALILVMGAGSLLAQTAVVVKTPADSSASALRVTIPRPWLNQVAAFALTHTGSSAWNDTVIVAGYKSGDFVSITRTTKSAHSPFIMYNQPYLAHLTTGRDTLIFIHLLPDTCTFHYRIGRKRL